MKRVLLEPHPHQVYKSAYAFTVSGLSVWLELDVRLRRMPHKRILQLRDRKRPLFAMIGRRSSASTPHFAFFRTATAQTTKLEYTTLNQGAPFVEMQHLSIYNRFFKLSAL